MPQFRITIDDTGEVFTCGSDTNVLDAMEAALCKGIPVGCRNGGCGACKARVVDGQYITRKMNVKEGDLDLGLHYNDTGSGDQTVVVILMDCPGWSKRCRPPVTSQPRAHQHAGPLRLFASGQNCTRGVATAQEPQPPR
jgi:ferredoxin